MELQDQVSDFVFGLFLANPEKEMDQKVSFHLFNSSNFILAGQFKISLDC